MNDAAVVLQCIVYKLTAVLVICRVTESGNFIFYVIYGFVSGFYSVSDPALSTERSLFKKRTFSCFDLFPEIFNFTAVYLKIGGYEGKIVAPERMDSQKSESIRTNDINEKEKNENTMPDPDKEKIINSIDSSFMSTFSTKLNIGTED